MEKLHLLFNTVNFLKLLFKITFPLLPTTEELNRSIELLKRSFLGVYFWLNSLKSKAKRQNPCMTEMEGRAEHFLP